MALKFSMEDLAKAQNQKFEGGLALWNARLEALVDSGDIRGAIDQLSTSVMDANNCGCNNGCGAVQREASLAD